MRIVSDTFWITEPKKKFRAKKLNQSKISMKMHNKRIGGLWKESVKSKRRTIELSILERKLSLKNPWDYNKRTNIHVIRVPKTGEKG